MNFSLKFSIISKKYPLNENSIFSLVRAFLSDILSLVELFKFSYTVNIWCIYKRRQKILI